MRFRSVKGLLFVVLIMSLVFISACGGDGSNATNGNTTGSAGDGNNDGNGDTNETASSGDGEEEVTIRVAWWGGQERHEMTLDAIDLFEEEYPHITVEPEYTDWDGYWERLSTQGAGNNLPDVINMDNSRMTEYSSRDLLMDLQPLIDEGLINLDDVDDVYQDINVTEDGAVLAISLGANALGIIQNDDVLSEYGVTLEPGYTYEDLQEAMTQIASETDEEFFGFDLNNADFELFYIYARQHGQSVFNENADGLGFDEDILVSYFEFIQSNVNNGISPPHDVTMDYIDGGNSMTGEGTAAAAMAASNQIIGLAQTTDMELSLNLPPTLSAGENGNWIRPSMSFAISSSSEQQEASAAFIDFFTNSIEANEILQADRGVPISSEVRNHLADQVEGPVAQTFEYLELVEDYTSPADPLPPPGEGEVRGSFQRMVESLKYDMATPEDAAQQFMQEAESILQ
ncbi:extracellular solute-binding protein [Paenalkalicoccus suaedae]|uniref:Extracellular solute-binding protein n=1 Tax=Paenalkalicoccus suaedae TaxID=2592382 RepID=A0A859FBR7_9BACI|nr:extracellular solute-binding protein [Paenalkalicoccus suaedae]QKS69735.1 extracellular solute-binding protein [Paenalkalicoccus suaedae]